MRRLQALLTAALAVAFVIKLLAPVADLLFWLIVGLLVFVWGAGLLIRRITRW